MTVSVRSWPQMAAVLRYDDGISTPTFGDLEEAAVAGDALAAVVAAVHTALDRFEAVNRIGFDIASAREFVSAVAKAVGR